METERISLNAREREQLKVLHEVRQEHLTQVEAGQRLGLSDRQVRRLLVRVAEQGDGGVVHRLRGAAVEPGDRRLDPAAHSGSDEAAVCRLRPHAGQRALGARRLGGEPRDVAQVDDRSGAVASVSAADPGGARLARAPFICTSLVRGGWGQGGTCFELSRYSG